MSAIYLQIKEDLQNKIDQGIYPIGQTIPNEIELAKQYGVSRPTVRQAIGLLVKEGIVERKRKRGTIVCNPKIDQGFTQKIVGFDEEMHQKGLLTSTVVLSFTKEMADEEVRSVLRCDEVYKIVRLRYINQEPSVFVTTYAPVNLFPQFEHIDFAKESFYSMCQKYNHKITYITRRLDVLNADETLADLLQIPSQSAIFYFHSYGLDQNHIPIEYSISKYRGDTNSFTIQLQG